jgi:4-amino-4-deoxy-L-arabinose transferase-like glycosyltransferase
MPLGQELDSEPRVHLTSLVGAALAWFVLVGWMSLQGHAALSVPVGATLTLASSVLSLHGLGFFGHRVAPERTLALKELAAPLAAAFAALVLLLISLRAAVAGTLPAAVVTSGCLVTLTSIALVVSLGWLAHVLRFDERAPELWRRQGLWLLIIGIVAYIPLLGSYSLYDPWETHYGEVAREMLAREDWISFWWAQENWFWSKPALDFWLQGLSFLLLGVRYQPDQMLAGAAEGHMPAPEWAARAPIILLTLIANYLAYKAVARVAGRRAGLWAGLALTFTPYWFFIAHQSMTDMPYAAPLTSALALLLLGLYRKPNELVRVVALRAGTRSAQVGLHHAALLLVLAATLPQLAYLLSRHISWSPGEAAHWLSFHADQFMAGSGGGNCGVVPGNDPCEPSQAVFPALAPGLMSCLWGALLAVFLWVNREERRAQRWRFIAAWFFIALSTLGKGAPGLVLPAVVCVVALAATRRWRDLERLEWGSACLVIACVALPWYVQAFARHGAGFTDRLLFYDMYKRAFVHVHDTNAGEDVSFRYYLWQLGYGLFPFTGLALWGFMRSFGAPSDTKLRDLLVFLASWGLLGFAMFSVSLTKFHHYALPVAPAAAMLTGLALNEFLGSESQLEWRSELVLWAAAFFSALGALLGALWLTQGSLFGALTQPTPGRILLGSAAMTLSVASFLGAVRYSTAAIGEQGFRSAVHGLIALISAALTLSVGRDLFSDGAVSGQARLVNLFSYNYARPWPASLDFEPAFRAVSLAAAVFLALMLLPRLRAQATRAFGMTCFLFTLFALDIYMVRAAPHWGQRETILTYYTTRSGPEEPLVAYQMNWKGENFYTGNRVAAFVTSGQKFRDWVSEQRENGTRVMYFTTEHSRMNGLKNELGKIKSFQVLTSEELNNKFFLARVEL